MRKIILYFWFILILLLSVLSYDFKIIGNSGSVVSRVSSDGNIYLNRNLIYYYNGFSSLGSSFKIVNTGDIKAAFDDVGNLYVAGSYTEHNTYDITNLPTNDFIIKANGNIIFRIDNQGNLDYLSGGMNSKCIADGRYKVYDSEDHFLGYYSINGYSDPLNAQCNQISYCDPNGGGYVDLTDYDCQTIPSSAFFYPTQMDCIDHTNEYTEGSYSSSYSLVKVKTPTSTYYPKVDNVLHSDTMHEWTNSDETCATYGGEIHYFYKVLSYESTPKCKGGPCYVVRVG